MVKFSKLMRKILNHSNMLTVILKEEIDILSLYTDLEQLRVRNQFEFEVYIDPALDIGAQKVPSMIIQPFLENAIWHGIQEAERPAYIKLSFVSENDYVEVRIEDNGVGFDGVSAKNSGHPRGMQLANERLELIGKLHGGTSDFHLESEVDMGTKIRFRFSKNLT